MTAQSGNDARVQRLTAARSAESVAKTQGALDSVARLLEAGQRVTFTAVARHADVSTWFLYNKPAARAAVEAAMAKQAEGGAGAATEPSATRVRPAGLQVELEMARDEIRTLRQERDRYRRKAMERLGDEVDEVSTGQANDHLLAYQQRVSELEVELRAAQDRAIAAEQLANDLRDDLTAARANLKKMIRKAPDR